MKVGMMKNCYSIKQIEVGETNSIGAVVFG